MASPSDNPYEPQADVAEPPGNPIDQRRLIAVPALVPTFLVFIASGLVVRRSPPGVHAISFLETILPLLMMAYLSILVYRYRRQARTAAAIQAIGCLLFMAVVVSRGLLATADVIRSWNIRTVWFGL